MCKEKVFVPFIVWELINNIKYPEEVSIALFCDGTVKLNQKYQLNKFGDYTS